ncbi:MMPL family transporter [Polymorphospora rubra]|uniref:Membrane protein n=1 Tax=Polymorphospora rubra TaxID=338584 RepID=A0A810MUR0_9ACTN|nr:MMPL family transporter [Polymorphospora rubra]BCJ63165.1 membrane protein [Polymorphospora rubra]
MSPLARLGAFTAHRGRRILIAGLLLTLALAGVGATAMGVLVLNRWEAPGSESVQARQLLERDFGTSNANLILLVTTQSGDVDSAEAVAAGTALADELRAEPMVGDVWSYWSQDGDPTLRSTDQRHALVLAYVEGDATTTRAEIRERLLPAYTRTAGPVSVQVAGSEAVSSQVSEQASQDFIRAELLIIPLMAVLLVVLYRRVRLALLTLGVGLFAVFGTLAGLRGLAEITEVSTFAANITLVMGIGLGVDYSLFVIARFREELTRGATVTDAVVTTVRTAGRTVIFSGLTVAAALSVMLAFPYSFLRSFAYAGVLVVVMAVLGALVLLPAALAVLGHRALRRGAAGTTTTGGENGFWYRLGARVMRRPVLFATAGLVLIGILGAPAIGLRIGLPDDRVLPPTASTRQAYDELRANFAQEANDAVHFVAPAGGATPGDAVARYAGELSRVPGVAQVNSTAGVFVSGDRISAAPAVDRLTSTAGQRLEAIPTREVLAGTDVTGLMERLRAVPAPFDELLIGGYPAELTDFRATLMDRVPLVGVLILVVTFVILFLMSGSLLIPVKATVLNLLSLTVMFGALVVIFQNGAFADLLGFTPIGTIDPTFPILIFCVAYGLSMDYEVFMLSRIKERYAETGDNTRAVLEGIQRSAPLVTAAAVILALSFSLYATGDVMYLQMVGIGVAIAVLVDATIIRAILVPAFMRLAGRANWWAPAPLRRLQQRLDPHRTDLVPVNRVGSVDDPVPMEGAVSTGGVVPVGGAVSAGDEAPAAGAVSA